MAMAVEIAIKSRSSNYELALKRKERRNVNCRVEAN